MLKNNGGYIILEYVSKHGPSHVVYPPPYRHYLGQKIKQKFNKIKKKKKNLK